MSAWLLGVVLGAFVPMPVALAASGAQAAGPLPTPQFRRYETANGLPSGAIYAAAQDRNGLMWFGSAGGLPWSGVRTLVGDPDTVLLATGGSRVYRSADGGVNWQRVPGFTGTVSWAGFESNTVGRIVGADGHTIWTTHDAGAHWTPLTFG